MALVTLANPLADIRGSLGGSVFSRDTSGLHLVSRKRHLQRRSPLQDRRRRAFVSAKNRWNSHTTAYQRLLWNSYAASHPGRNAIGEPIELSGYQMFMRFNIYRAYNEVALILIPPEG